MTQIAMKFVQWDVPELEKLKDSKVYKLRERLDNGDKLSREEKNWLTRNVKECCHFKRGIALMGYRFDFSDVSNGISWNNTDILPNIMPLTKPHYVLSYMVELKI